jgi:hypothetical protein
VLRGFSGAIADLAFTPDGASLAAAHPDGTWEIYACRVCGTADDVDRLAKRLVKRRLTDDERVKYLHEPLGKG